MNFFTKGAGRIVALPDFGFPMLLSLANWDGFFTMKAIITQLSLGSEANAQFMHTLRNFIYVYVFGERIGEMVIGGLAATAGQCGEAEGVITGFENVIHYYNRYRLSEAGLPVAISIGVSLNYHGFLVGCKSEFTDPQSGISQFLLRIRFFPSVFDHGSPTDTVDPTLTSVPPTPGPADTNIINASNFADNTGDTNIINASNFADNTSGSGTMLISPVTGPPGTGVPIVGPSPVDSAPAVMVAQGFNLSGLPF